MQIICSILAGIFIGHMLGILVMKIKEVVNHGN